MFRIPSAPAVQTCPSRPGLKSNARTDPSCGLIDMISNGVYNPNLDTLNSSSIPPEIT